MGDPVFSPCWANLLSAMRARFSHDKALDILVADYQRLTRDGVVLHLKTCSSLLNITEADDYHSLFGALESQPRFDLIICEVAMPGPPWQIGLKHVRSLAPTTPILAIAAGDQAETVSEALQAGATSFVPKTVDGLTFLHAAQVSLAGLRYIPVTTAGGRKELNVTAWPNQLTRRQQQILCLMAQGLSNKEIARNLSLAEGTVKIHVTAVNRLMGARNRVQAVLAAREQGLI